MPLGGENTNTVIAAHRGYYGAEMLRNVQPVSYTHLRRRESSFE